MVFKNVQGPPCIATLTFNQFPKHIVSGHTGSCDYRIMGISLGLSKNHLSTVSQLSAVPLHCSTKLLMKFMICNN